MTVQSLSQEKGRPGYDPRMLAVLLVYACLQAERSSRKIEERCRTDAAFRVATGNRSLVTRRSAGSGARLPMRAGRWRICSPGCCSCWAWRGWAGWT